MIAVNGCRAGGKMVPVRIHGIPGGIGADAHTIIWLQRRGGEGYRGDVMPVMFLRGQSGKKSTHGAGDGRVIVDVDRQIIVTRRTFNLRLEPMGVESGSEEQTDAKYDGHQSA